jgi:hypothetical protein
MFLRISDRTVIISLYNIHRLLLLNRDEVCLLRGRDLPLNKIQVNYSLYRINAAIYIQSLWKLSRCVTIKLTTCVQSNKQRLYFNSFNHP